MDVNPYEPPQVIDDDGWRESPDDDVVATRLALLTVVVVIGVLMFVPILGLIILTDLSG